MLALYTSRYMRAQASFFFHCRMCLRKLSAPLPCKSLLEPVCRSTCKADLSSHLGCSRLSQCCFLTCKLLACPRSMQVYRYSSQKSTEQPKCKDLQRTLHPIRAHQTQNNPEVRRCRVSVLNRINSTLPLSLFFKNHTRAYTNSPKGFLWKPAAGSQSPAASSGRGD